MTGEYKRAVENRRCKFEEPILTYSITPVLFAAGCPNTMPLVVEIPELRPTNIDDACAETDNRSTPIAEMTFIMTSVSDPRRW